ncbi:MAG: hypothetical protein CW341_01655 [Bacteroidetes bacterium]|nr:hypothetical protein [Bacteroidota bacterium]
MKSICLVISLVLNVILLILFIHCRKAYHRVMKLYLQKEKMKNEIVEAVTYDTKASDSEQDRNILEQLQKVMEKDKLYLNPGLDMQSLARAIGTNRSTLSHVINNCLHQNFATFLNRYRIREAIQLLSDSQYFDYKIEVIGEMCGYNNRQVFHAAFKKETGITPTHFRKISKNQKKEMKQQSAKNELT